MTNLTRNQIIEIRARAITKVEYLTYIKMPSHNTISEEDFMEQNWQDNIIASQATIEVDEKAGVLMLVEDMSDFTKQDLIQDKFNREVFQINPNGIRYNNRGTFGKAEPDEHLKIIQRATTPVYQTRRE